MSNNATTKPESHIIMDNTPDTETRFFDDFGTTNTYNSDDESSDYNGEGKSRSPCASIICGFVSFIYNHSIGWIPIMNPVGSFRSGWDIVVTIVLVYTCIEIPYTLAFEIELTLTHWSGILAFVIDVFLLCDVTINFRTAYFDNYDNIHLITNPKKIAKQLSLFILCFVSSCSVFFFFCLLFCWYNTGCIFLFEYEYV